MPMPPMNDWGKDSVFAMRPFESETDLRLVATWQLQEVYRSHMKFNPFLDGAREYFQDFIQAQNRALYTLLYVNLPCLLVEILPVDETELVSTQIAGNSLVVRIHLPIVRDQDDEQQNALLYTADFLKERYADRELILAVMPFQEVLLHLLEKLKCNPVLEIGVMKVFPISCL